MFQKIASNRIDSESHSQQPPSHQSPTKSPVPDDPLDDWHTLSRYYNIVKRNVGVKVRAVSRTESKAERDWSDEPYVQLRQTDGISLVDIKSTGQLDRCISDLQTGPDNENYYDGNVINLTNAVIFNGLTKCANLWTPCPVCDRPCDRTDNQQPTTNDQSVPIDCLPISMSCCCNSFSDCLSCFHTVCATRSTDHKCVRNFYVYPTVPVTHHQPTDLTQWTVQNVGEWLASVNFGGYVETFKQQKIDGKELLAWKGNVRLCEERVTAIIINKYDAIGITAAISDLTSSRTDPIVGNSTQREKHHWLDGTFDTITQCSICWQSIYGNRNQGRYCTRCYLVAHRSCVTNYGATMKCTIAEPGCQVVPYEQRTLCELSGVGTTSGRSVPLFLERYITRIEKYVRDAEKTDLVAEYSRSKEVFVHPNLLRKALTSNYTSGTDDKTWTLSCDIVGHIDLLNTMHVMRHMLYRLPDPVIPVQFYEAFLRATRMPNVENVKKYIRNLIDQLPVQHRDTLSYIMRHFAVAFRTQQSPKPQCNPIQLFRDFGTILMRPPWPEIYKIYHNYELQAQVLSLIFYHGGDWSTGIQQYEFPAPALPPRISTPRLKFPSGSKSDLVDGNLGTAEWYWGNITKDEVKEKLLDCPDGTYLVRDASNQTGEYTLTLVKDGSLKLIKIYHSNGKYGFSHQTLEFDSVVDLINYYKVESLAKYNYVLDTKLLYPISKYKESEEIQNVDMDVLVAKFNEALKDYTVNTTEYNKIVELYERNEEVRNLKRQGLDAFNMAVNIYECQIKIQSKYRVQAQPHEVKNVLENFERLTERLQLLKDIREKLQKELDEQKLVTLSFERKIQQVKPVILNLSRQKEKFHELLIRRGVTEQQIKTLMDGGAIEWPLNGGVVQPKPHHIQSLWYLPDCSRLDAERLLSGRPTGTFLIRPRVMGNYALSIVCNDTTNHCIIYETDQGCGFAIPYNLYGTLMSLVLHYADNSLEDHNETLATTLKYPVKWLKKTTDANGAGTSGIGTQQPPPPPPPSTS